MKGPIWKVDEFYQVELKFSFLGKYRILVNGQEVVNQRVKKNTAIPFTLEDGRKAEMSVITWGGLSPEWELRVENQLILSNRQIKEMSCPKCGKGAKTGDKFCEKCGAELPNAENQLKVIRLKGARKTIAGLALIFLISGLVLFFVQKGTSDKNLDNLSRFKDSDAYPELINGKQMTVGELRQDIQQETWGILILNGILCVIMVGLYFYAKKSPLVAILMAGGVYASVIVLNAIVDPKTIGQGLAMKIIIIAFLVKGIRSALELRKAGI